MEAFSCTEKNIRLIVRKQLKKEYPNWKRLNGTKKKAIGGLVLKDGGWF